MKKSLILIILILILGLSVTAFAAETNTKPADNAKSEPKVVQGTFTGKINCVDCVLKSEAKAGAQCSAYGHHEALKISKATDSNGKAIDIKEGTWIHFMPTDKSKELSQTIKHGEKAEIQGKYYPQADSLEIESFKKIEEKK